MSQTRRLAAILAADVAGYSRLMGADEGGTLQALKEIRAELIDPTISKHNGRLVKTTGDGLLVEFGSVGTRATIVRRRNTQEQLWQGAEDRSAPGDWSTPNPTD